MKILILAANPQKDLSIDCEIRELRDAIEQSHKPEQHEVEHAPAVRVEDLQNLFLKHKPQIVHFCGHGMGEQGLVLDSDRGGEQVSTEALAGLLERSGNRQPIQCVLLNACYSEIQAETFTKHVDYVIGMRQEIQDKAAIAFSTGFYLALGYGCPIDECYKWGCNAIQLKLGRSNTKDKQRKLEPEEEPDDSIDSTIIPEHLKPILKIKSNLVPTTPVVAPNIQKDEIQKELIQALEPTDLDPEKEQIPIIPPRNADEEDIPDFLNCLLEVYFSKSSLKWSLCFTGEDESSKLVELIGGLKNGFSDTGNGKRISSGFSYWGIVSTLAWVATCRDHLYPVMSDGTSSFIKRWNDIFDQNLTTGKYNYVSLGVGTGDKDNEILKRLYSSNNSIRYFPIDLSSTMLRLGSQKATENIPIKGSHVLPIQIDFSIRSNIIELRLLLDRLGNTVPILFSLLGNTLANFSDDTELLQTVSELLRPGDKLLLGVATTEEINEEAAAAAAKEYANASSFKKFVISTLHQYTDLQIDFENIRFEGSIESGNRSLFIKVLYRNSDEQTISIMLADLESVKFNQGDTIRLLTTRKYSSKGLNEVISDSKLRKIASSSSLFGGHNRYGFGIDLSLLMKESE